MSKILVIEDEEDLANAIAEWLADEHHLVETEANGSEALKKLGQGSYDMAIVDWMLPDLSGLDVCRQFRQAGGAIPLLMLTARASLESKEMGLDAGADDYLTKPFQLRELSARVRALLRRPLSAPIAVYELEGIRLDRNSCRVSKDGADIHLLPKEFSLLELFMRNPGKVISVSELLDKVWGSDTEVVPETVRSSIRTLRSKIDTPGSPSLIKTVHGMGYKLEANNER